MNKTREEYKMGLMPYLRKKSHLDCLNRAFGAPYLLEGALNPLDGAPYWEDKAFGAPY